jgi:hypothetical protein
MVAYSGGPAAIAMNETRRKNKIAIRAPAANPNALYRTRSRSSAFRISDDLVLHHAVDQSVVLGALGKTVRKQRFGCVATLTRLAGREDRDDAPGAFDQLQVRDQIAQLLNR